MGYQVFGDQVLWSWGPMPVTQTMVVSASVSLVLVVAGWWLGRRASGAQGGTAAYVADWVVQTMDGTVAQILGRRDERVAVLAGTLFLFIAACNVSGILPGVHPATASLATTSALAAVVFCAVPAVGIAAQGPWAYLARYVRPNVLFLPLHVVSELSRTVALSLRLFGNVMSGQMIAALMLALAGFLVPLPFMALDLLIGLLQAYIFAVLAAVFMGAALSGDLES